MIWFILFFILVFTVGKLQKSLRVHPSASHPSVPVVLSVLAWGIVILFGISLWDVIKMILDLSIFNVLTLAAILTGGAFMYQYLITASEAGSMEVLFRRFSNLLLFRAGERKTDDIFVELEEMKMRREWEKEKEKISERETSSRNDYGKYWES
jgi:hypothetical protein